MVLEKYVPLQIIIISFRIHTSGGCGKSSVSEYSLLSQAPRSLFQKLSDQASACVDIKSGFSCRHVAHGSLP